VNGANAVGGGVVVTLVVANVVAGAAMMVVDGWDQAPSGGAVVAYVGNAAVLHPGILRGKLAIASCPVAERRRAPTLPERPDPPPERPGCSASMAASREMACLRAPADALRGHPFGAECYRLPPSTH
jgi:hypothetical protein